MFYFRNSEKILPKRIIKNCLLIILLSMQNRDSEKIMIKSYRFFWMNHLLQSELTSNSLASFIAFFIRSIHLLDRVPGSTNLFISPVSVRKKRKKEKKNA